MRASTYASQENQPRVSAFINTLNSSELILTHSRQGKSCKNLEATTFHNSEHYKTFVRQESKLIEHYLKAQQILVHFPQMFPFENTSNTGVLLRKEWHQTEMQN